MLFVAAIVVTAVLVAVAGHPFDAFVADKNRYDLYVSGAHRRATDPVSTEEVDVVIALLFGPSRRVATLAHADALLADPAAFGAITSRLKANEMVYPEFINGHSFVPAPMPPDQAATIFMAALKENAWDVAATTAWARGDEAMRSSLRLNTIQKVILFVNDADKDEIIAAELAIERGEVPVFHRYLMVDFANGISDVDVGTGDAYQTRVRAIVDTTDITAPFIVPEMTEVTREYIGNVFNNLPENAPPTVTDISYMLAFAKALYDDGTSGEQGRFFGLTEGTNPVNIAFTTNFFWSYPQKFFVAPFDWAGSTEVYGRRRNETIIQASLTQYTLSVAPIDGHAINSGTALLYQPLTLVYSALYDMIAPQNLLVNSSAIAVAWYGRGLSFTAETAQQVRDAIDYETFKCMAPTMGQRWNHAYFPPGLPHKQTVPEYVEIDCVRILPSSDLAFVRTAVSEAISEAWGEEEVFGVQPGVLAVRDTDGALVPRLVIEHPYDTPVYANHATPKQLQDAYAANGMKTTRDIRDNPPDMSPPLDEDGNGVHVPMGKRIDAVFPEGKSFEMDGYKVTYDVGVKWKFSIGFLQDAGLTLYNVRFVLPPSRAHPQGEEVPYIWKLNIARFGTTYANSAFGNLYAASFLESHSYAIADTVPEANCRGAYATLPIFHTNFLQADQGPYLHANLSFYSWYGLSPMNVDPLARLLLGIELPLNAYPFDKTYNGNGYGVIEHGVCIQEQDLGTAGMWHMYTSQRLRSLAVYSSTVSEAYNVVNRFEFFSNGRIQVAENLHGYPAIMGHGIPFAGGAYSAGGRGSFGSNHLHWSIVAIHPNLKKTGGGGGGANVTNKIQVSDLVLDHPSNWYGTAYHREHVDVTMTGNRDQMMYNFDRDRAWLITAVGTEGQHLGSLKVSSNAFGPPPMRSLTDPAVMRYDETDFTEDDTILASWWLQQNVWILNDANEWNYQSNPSNRATLLAEPETPNCRLGGTARRCVELKNEPVVDGASLNVVMKVYHGVTTEETPVQNGFTAVITNIWPHNLFTFNPNMLARQQVAHNDRFENSYMATETQYTAPYSSEFD